MGTKVRHLLSICRLGILVVLCVTSASCSLFRHDKPNPAAANIDVFDPEARGQEEIRDLEAFLTTTAGKAIVYGGAAIIVLLLILSISALIALRRRKEEIRSVQEGVDALRMRPQPGPLGPAPEGVSSSSHTDSWT